LKNNQHNLNKVVDKIAKGELIDTHAWNKERVSGADRLDFYADTLATKYGMNMSITGGNKTKLNKSILSFYKPIEVMTSNAKNEKN